MKNRNWLLLLLAILPSLIYVSCTKDSTTTYVGNWKTVSELKGVARYGALSFVIGSNGYCGSGEGDTEYLNDFWKYDSEADTWTQIGSFPGTARKYGVGFGIDAVGYVGTGWDGYNYLKDFWKYTPSTNSWTQLNDFESSEASKDYRSGAIGFSINGKGYVGTGYNGNYLGDFYEYNPTTDTWTEETSFSGGKRWFGTSFVIGTKAYVCTGKSGEGYVKDMNVFDSETDTWTKLGTEIYNSNTDETFDDDYTDIIRSNGVGFTIGKKGYIALGTNGSITAKVWEYNPTTDRWSRKTAFEGSSRQDAVSFSINGRAFVGTGLISSSVYDDFWEFLPDETYNSSTRY